MDMREIMYWNARSYGSAVRIPRRSLRLIAVGLCLITPCTNVLIPFITKILPRDLLIRYG